MNNFRIRHARMEDYEEILKIYERARRFMAEHDNPRQWNTKWPPAELIKEDIEQGRNYVCVMRDESYNSEGKTEDGSDICNRKNEGHGFNEKIAAVFVYLEGEDPTYVNIEDGAWLDDSMYGVIHRMAVSGDVKGAATFSINWAYDKLKHLRVDTHGDNYVMQNLLSKLGFVRTGTIYVVEDNDPRFAYEKSEKI